MARFREDKPYRAVCTGLNKTGTTTIGAVFKCLGLRTMGFQQGLNALVAEGRMDVVLQKMDHHHGFQELPFPLIYREMHAHFGDDIRFIHTMHASPAEWLRSIKRHSLRNGGTRLRSRIYGATFPHLDEQAYLDTYNRHNDAVQNYALVNGIPCLVVTIGERDLTEKIAAFLNEPLLEILQKTPSKNRLSIPRDPSKTRFARYFNKLNRHRLAKGQTELTLEEAMA